MMSDTEILMRLMDRVEGIEQNLKGIAANMVTMTQVFQEHRARIQALEKTIEQWEKR
jgi:hypothetical protein